MQAILHVKNFLKISKHLFIFTQISKPISNFIGIFSPKNLITIIGRCLTEIISITHKCDFKSIKKYCKIIYFFIFIFYFIKYKLSVYSLHIYHSVYYHNKLCTKFFFSQLYGTLSNY